MQNDLFSESNPLLDLPNASIQYYPDFIRQHVDSSHESLYELLKSELVWQQDTIKSYGKSIPIPRLNAWYGDEDAHYSYSGIQLTPKPWTDTLYKIKCVLDEYVETNFNSVLANHYRNERDSVSWHSDDEPELGEQPLIASLSLGATRRFSLRDKKNQFAPVHIDLEGGSLLVMSGETQHYWKHQVPKSTRTAAGRINLTFRRILPAPI